MNRKSDSHVEKKIDVIEDISQFIEDISQRIGNDMREFVEILNVDSSLSGKDRMRLFGAGVKNNGFIDQTFDIARDNVNFTPRTFNLQLMLENKNKFERLMHLVLTLQGFLDAANNAFITQSDVCFREALTIYGNLRVLSKARVSGTQELYDSLKTFFAKSKRAGAEPTEEELMRDVRSLMHGTKDGKVVIENVAPKTVGGVRKVVDEMNTSKRAVKESLKEED